MERTRNKVACIFGVTGQDGVYLANYLQGIGYKVVGVVRRVSHPNPDYINDIVKTNIEFVEGDLSDSSSIGRIISLYKPDELYNLAAQSHVGTSFNQPEYTADVTGLGHLRILEQVRLNNPTTRVYFAGSSEQFGDVKDIPQNEETEFRPRSPYAAAKVFGNHIGKVYRESYGLYVSNGILFNHESPRRGLQFVTRKITDYIGRCKAGLESKPLELGYLDAKRDWGFAGDYVKGMHLMLQKDTPDDYVLATGEAHSVREFAEIAFKSAGHELVWEGCGVEEKGYILTKGNSYQNWSLGVKTIWSNTIPIIVINPEYYRPNEVPLLLGNYSKARKVLGWSPTTSFQELVNMMVDHDIRRYADGVHSKN